MRWRALVAVLLILIAGCSGQTTTSAPDPTTVDPTAETTTPATNTATTTEQLPRNPWEKETVTVALSRGGYENQEYQTAVQRAVSYWNEDMDASGYDVQMTLDPNATDADIEVQYREEINLCGDDTSDAGFSYCVDNYVEGETETGTTDVYIQGGYTANSTTMAVKYALGDLLNVDESDYPASLPEWTTPTPRDPWLSPGPVVVGINQSATPRNMTGLVEESVAYWENVDDSSKNYSTEFTVRPNSTDPDVLVEFTPEISSCGIEVGSSYLGCAPTLSGNESVSEVQLIEVKTGYTDASTLETLKHEFGHLHGRLHGQEPMPLMNETGEGVRLPQPDATEVAYPWQTETLTVAVTGDLTGTEPNQVDHALTYFEEGADGLLSETTPTFERTENSSQADIVIEVSDSGSACEDMHGGGSCGTVFGYSIDADDALEYYTRAEITIADINEDRVGWHVGYWLAYSFGATEGGYPEPLDDDGNDDRDGRWWE